MIRSAGQLRPGNVVLHGAEAFEVVKVEHKIEKLLCVWLKNGTGLYGFIHDHRVELQVRAREFRVSWRFHGELGLRQRMVQAVDHEHAQRVIREQLNTNVELLAVVEVIK